MRAAILLGLIPGVLAIHVLAWQIAVAGWPRFALPRAGAARLVLAVVPRPAPPAAARHDAPAAPPAQALRESLPASKTTLARPPARTAVRPTGVGGSARSGAAGERAWPVYPTRPPPSTTRAYRLVLATGRGAGAGGGVAVEGSAQLEWVRTGEAWSLRLATSVPGRPPREWDSAGDFDAAGAAPQRLVEREKGRDKRAVDFDRAAGRVRFSGNAPSLPMAPGAQDRWSWIAQLAAIAEAAASGGRGIAAGTTWHLQVAGLRGDIARWVFRVLPDALLPAAGRLGGDEVSTETRRAPDLLHVVREPEHPYDLRIEA